MTEPKVTAIYEMHCSWPTSPMMNTGTMPRRAGGMVRFACNDPDKLVRLVELVHKDGLLIDSLKRLDAYASVEDAVDEFMSMKMAKFVQQPSTFEKATDADEVSPAATQT